jgi:hypothetical protein
LDRSVQIQELTPAQLVSEQQGGTLILDARAAEQFAAFHIRGSIQISLLGHFAAWAAMLLDPATQLVLIAEDERHAREAHERLIRVGIAHVIGYSLPNEQQWREQASTSPRFRSSAAKTFMAPNDPTRRCSSSTSAAAPSG